jgi:hypothetical protein
MIKVNYDNEDSAKITKDISKVYDSLCKFFSVKAFDVTVNVYSNRNNLNIRLGRKTEDWLVANTSCGTNEVDILSPIAMEKESSHDKSEFLQIIKHEFTHLFIQKIAQGKAIPKWLNEGLASYVAKQNQTKQEAIYIEKSFIKKLSTPKGWNEMLDYSAYYISAQFVQFLIKKFSFKKILELLTSLDENYYYPKFEEIFLKVYKKELDEVEELFITGINN